MQSSIFIDILMEPQCIMQILYNLISLLITRKIAKISIFIICKNTSKRISKFIFHNSLLILSLNSRDANLTRSSDQLTAVLRIFRCFKCIDSKKSLFHGCVHDRLLTQYDVLYCSKKTHYNIRKMCKAIF